MPCPRGIRRKTSTSWAELLASLRASVSVLPRAREMPDVNLKLRFRDGLERLLPPVSLEGLTAALGLLWATAHAVIPTYWLTATAYGT